MRTRVKCCVEDINSWMIKNKLKLNDDKTELVVISSIQNTNQDLLLRQFRWERRPSIMRPLCEISMFCWIKSTQFHLRNIGKIRKYLDEGCTETLVHAFVSSKLDYCNPLLYGLLKCLINRLQLILVHNTAAHLVISTPKVRSYNTSSKRLHWLPVSHHIIFKILLLIYK